jgi:cysteine desulfurase
VSIKGIVGEELLKKIPELAASTGSACHAGSTEPSAVLIAMGIHREQALGALRLSLGRWSTKEEVATISKLIVERTSDQNSVYNTKKKDI